MYLSPQDIMNKYEESLDRLDTEFDHLLLDMKPYVLKNSDKAGKTSHLLTKLYVL